MYEAMGLCEEGKGGDLVNSGKWIKNKQGEKIFYKSPSLDLGHRGSLLCTSRFAQYQLCVLKMVSVYLSRRTLVCLFSSDQKLTHPGQCIE